MIAKPPITVLSSKCTQVSHVVVDETHERQAQGDFLLTALRELVEGSRANTNFTVKEKKNNEKIVKITET